MIHDTMTSLYPISEEQAKEMAGGADLNVAAEPPKGKPIEEAAKAPAKDATLKGGMTAQQIRERGWAIDLPFDSPDAKPGRCATRRSTRMTQTTSERSGCLRRGSRWAASRGRTCRQLGNQANPRQTRSRRRIKARRRTSERA